MMSPQAPRHRDILALWLMMVMIVSGCSKQSIVSSAEEHAAPADPAPASVEEAPSVAPQAPPEEPELRVEEEPVATATPVEPVPQPKEPLAEISDVYFDFDKSAIRGDAQATLERLAGLLASEPNQELVIEGHCDERGTSAYNFLLGERRAQAAKHYLEKHGLSASQIQVTSYGKERPFCTEHSETCWQSNRRVHFRMP